jgi:DNA-binding NtrC family response regulator
MNTTNSAAISGSFCHFKLPDETQQIEILAAGAMPKVAPDRRPRVLVVDDESLITDVVEKALSFRLKAQVTKVHDGVEAIKDLSENSYDLIISDMRMPIMSGLSLFEWMQDNTPSLCSRFFMMSGDLGGPEVAHQLSDLGVKVLKKPFTLEMLINTSREYLESNPASTPSILVH